MEYVSSTGVGHIHYIDNKMDTFQYFGVFKQNVKQITDKLNILDTLLSTRTLVLYFFVALPAIFFLFKN